MVLVKRKECIFSNVRVKSTKYHIYISYKTKFPMALFLFRTRESWKKSWWNAQCWVTNLWRRRRRSVMKIMENICIMKNIGGRWTLNRNLCSHSLTETPLWHRWNINFMTLRIYTKIYEIHYLKIHTELCNFLTFFQKFGDEFT